MNLLDFYVYLTDPERKLRRAQASAALAHYEAARPSPHRRRRMDNRSPNTLVGASAIALRAHARYLERNHDLSRGALRVLVNCVIGPAGIQVEPQPRRRDGTLHLEYAQKLREGRRLWDKRPEVTRRLSWPMAQRMLAYTWFRDGEAFSQKLIGEVPFLRHATAVPFSLELLEPDFVPLDFNDPARRIRQGIQTNAWNQPTAFHVYRNDPRDAGTLQTTADLKSVGAERMLHIAIFDRLHQDRGVSEFASVMTRLEDLKDYEESERVAAKVAASMTAYVKRVSPDGYNAEAQAGETDESGRPTPRDLRLQPGMIIDSLQVGEEIGLIDANRPSPNLVGWRQGQLRAFAAGIGAAHSSVSKDYDGSYTAMRQELVESWIHYAVLTEEFSSMCVLPVHESYVMASHLSGTIPMPADVDPATASDCLLLGQSMPWIDPLKEAIAYEKLVRAGFASEVEVIRKRGGNPRDTMDQIQQWREDAVGKGLRFSSDVASDDALSAALLADPAGATGRRAQ